MASNLVFNGDFSQGTAGWNGISSLSGNEATLTGNLSHNVLYKFPTYPGLKYQVSFDIKFNSTCSSTFLFYFDTYDEDEIHIGPSEVVKVSATATNTTLATPLNNGDTTVTLTSATGWKADTTYRYIGICDNPKWGYCRTNKEMKIAQNGISGNVLTLQSAWNKGSFPAGTKVANFTDANTYVYPVSITPSTITLNTWQTKSNSFIHSNIEGARDWGAKYFRVGTLGYTYNYTIRNIVVTESTGAQTSELDYNKTFKVSKNGIITAQPREVYVDKSRVYNTGTLTSSYLYEY